MNDFVPQGLRNGECSSIEHRSSWRGADGADMTGGAADLFENVLAFLSGRRCGENRIAWRNLRTADELSEMVDVREAEIVRSIFWICRSFADGCHVFGTKAVCHSHLV